jgi:hypothetical protein
VRSAAPTRRSHADSERSSLSVTAVVKDASKPLWIARHAMATARCIVSRPGFPATIRDCRGIRRRRIVLLSDGWQCVPIGKFEIELECGT